MFVHISRAKRDGHILAEYPEFIHLTQTGSTRTYFHHVRQIPRHTISTLILLAEMGRTWSKDRRNILGNYCGREEGVRNPKRGGLHCSTLCLLKFNGHQVTMHIEDIRQNARVIDELDVALGFANLAVEMNFCRPTMTDEYARPLIQPRKRSDTTPLHSLARPTT
jgi:hypothetical protein